MKISMVIPCYNSSLTIADVTEQLGDIYRNMKSDYEIILVNDCSKDDTWDVISELCDSDEHVKGINLSKNAGQHAAVMAGFRAATGELIMSSDDDGQTPIENIPQMVNLLFEKNYDCVCAKYVEFEKKTLFRRFGTFLMKKIIYWLIDSPPNIEVRIFMVMRRHVADEICKYTQPYPIFNGLLLRVTHNIGNIEMVQHKRKAGTSGYSLKKLIHTFVNSFAAFSIKPLRFATYVGVLSAMIGFVFGLFVIIRKLIEPSMQAGYSSTMAVILFMSGLILMVLGMIGEYLGRTYMSITHMPQYVIRSTKNIKHNEKRIEK